LSSATEGVDFKFNPTSKIINITSNTPDTITVNVPFYDDKNFELTKKIYFGLGNLSNSKITKGKDTLIVTLLNDDLPIYKIGTINKQTSASKTADSLNVRCRVFGTVHGVNMRVAGMNFTIMDGTGGMGVFTNPKTFGYTVTEGDSIMIQGTVSQFQGLVQLDKLDTIIKIATAQPLKKAKVVSGVDESTESVLVQMRRVKMVDPAEWPSAALAANGFKNVRVMNTSGRVDTLNIDAETDIDGSTAPVGYFDVTGIGGQFDNSTPYLSRYVLSPRSINDFKASTLPTVNFAKSKDSIFEPADSFRMDFSVIPADENFSFDVAIAGGTAVSPTDYDFATRKINVLKNVSSFFIRANISDDGDPDGDKILIFAIRNAQGPCFIGKDSLLTLKIKDNEASVVKGFAAASIKMYPNPSTGTVQINSVEDMKMVRVYTMGGQLVREVSMNNMMKSNALTMELNVGAGLYRVQVVTVGGDMYSDFLSIQ
jgi:DNA/RNA endonuclease YhcR with UshA esterase domain